MDLRNGILRVAGKIEPTEIVKMLENKCGLIVYLKRPNHLPKKEVILSGLQIGREDPVTLPSDLRSLRIFACHGPGSLSDIRFLQQTTDQIEDCGGIESMIDLSSSSSSSSFTPFQNLESLWLENLDNLEKLVKAGEASVDSTWSSLPLTGIFSNLKSFQIERCSNMKQLFPFDLVVHDLQNLENLVVVGCEQMEEIIAAEEEEENHKGKGTNSPMTLALPQLRKLKLNNLPQLKSICSSNRIMTCDSLRDIEVGKCPMLKRMPLYLPLFDDIDQPHSHPSGKICIYPNEWWESVEWDYPNAKNVLLQRWLVEE